jgi:hypothetical protein
MEWRIKTEQSEITLESLDHVVLWYQQRKVQDHHYVYHPVLGQWMYVKDLEELRALRNAMAVPIAPGPRYDSRPAPAVVVQKGTGACGWILIIALGIVVAIVIMSLF